MHRTNGRCLILPQPVYRTQNPGGWTQGWTGDQKPNEKVGRWNLKGNIMFRQSQAFNYLSIIGIGELGRRLNNWERNTFTTLTSCISTYLNGPNHPAQWDFVDVQDSSLRSLEGGRNNLGTQPSLVLVVLNRKSSGLMAEEYANVKQWGDRNVGIPTICVVWENLTKASQSGAITLQGFETNIALKTNIKLRGTNHDLQEPFTALRNDETMIVGADTTHPAFTPHHTVHQSLLLLPAWMQVSRTIRALCDCKTASKRCANFPSTSQFLKAHELCRLSRILMA